MNGAAAAAPPPAPAGDPELRLDRVRTDLHSLRAADPELDSLSARIQLTAAAGAVALLRRDDGARAATLSGRRVLVTGAAGYLGSALCLALDGLGAEVVGLDVVAGGTVSIVADVADAAAVRAAAAGCGGVLHTAALHAPHATHYTEAEFAATNISGTQNVLDAAAAAGRIPVVHTSTTSLTITPRVKRAEKAGQLVWLDATSQPPGVPAAEAAAADPADRPRNKYGRTKLEGERRCVAAAAAGTPCVIVRISRCFPEDELPDPAGQAAALLGANFKANELLGRRVALVDVVAGHLRALSRAGDPLVCGQVFTLCAPFPWAKAETPAETAAFLGFLQDQRPGLAGVYAKLGWSLPADVGRVYDSALAVELLGWRPQVTFDNLIAAAAAAAGGGGGGPAAGIDPEDARAGCY